MSRGKGVRPEGTEGVVYWDGRESWRLGQDNMTWLSTHRSSMIIKTDMGNAQYLSYFSPKRNLGLELLRAWIEFN